MFIQTTTVHPVAHLIADFAVNALMEEVQLTPKPGLVDRDGNGCHYDLNLLLMEKSALALRPTFYEMSLAGSDKEPSQKLREQLGAIGRYGEEQMLMVTGNVNTHKGSIWCLGLLTAATSMLISREEDFYISDIIHNAALIAKFEDRNLKKSITNGALVTQKYQVISAREQAILGFPALTGAGLPAWKKYQNEPEDVRRINVLLALIAVLDDTCILHRSDMVVLNHIKQSAKVILEGGGFSVPPNKSRYQNLINYMSRKWVSPGGSADMLAACIFINKIANHFKIN